MPSKRAKNWKVKTSPDLFLPVWKAKHEQASKEVSQAYKEIDELYAKISPILDKHGIAGNLRLLYRSFMEELWRLSNRFSGKTFEIEAEAIAFKYCFYEADWRILKEIGKVFNLDLFRRLVERYKEAFETAYTLTSPSVAQNPVTISFLYSPEGKILQISTTDEILGLKKTSLLEYDLTGKLIRILEVLESV